MKGFSIATRTSLALTLLALTISFGVALLCYLFMRTELSFDRSVPRAADTYRVNLTISPPGAEPVTLPTLTAATAAEIGEIGGVVDVTRLSLEDLPVRIEDEETRLPVYVVDANFPEFFGLGVVAGDASSMLVDPGSVVVSREMALALFGTSDAIGQEIEFAGAPRRVTGVVERSGLTHLDPEILVSSNTPSTRLAIAADGGLQGEFFARTYVRLDEVVEPSTVREAINALPRNRPVMPPSQVEALNPQLSLQPVTDIHLDGLPAGELEPSGNPQLVWAIVAVGVLILGTACLNLAILVGADASGRLSEIGVRRAFGASRLRIVGGFAGQYALIASACMLAACLFIVPILPVISEFLGRELALQWPFDLLPIMAIPGVALITAIAALAFSSSGSVNAPPAVALKGELEGRGVLWRAVAASVQFALSIALISATFIIGSQVSMAVDDSLSIGTDDVLILDGLREPFPPTGQRTLADLVDQIPGVVSVGLSEIVPTDMSTTVVGLFNPAAGMQQPVGFEANQVDAGFFETYGVAPVAGTLFSDESTSNEIILSLSAVSGLGFSSAQEAVGAMVSMASADGMVPFEVLGVVPDVPMKSIEGDAERLVFTHVGNRARFLSVRIVPGQNSAVRSELQSIWPQFSTDAPDISSLRGRLEALYRPLTQAFLFFGVLSATALAIATLGISATANFTAERRHKEMGLRRAMGASRIEVTWELLSSIVGPVVIATAIAIPLSVVWGNGWLSGFAQRIPLSVMPIGAAAALMFVVALMAAGCQVIPIVAKAPADALGRDR